ncbi:hypothetical protein NFI96_014262 [Prochilodus magdalenae]|nr:hypothetical protein NFI96_014262 [Prochilodus magdalenae]
MPQRVKLFVMVFGNTLNSHMTFMDDLMSSPNLCKVKSENESDVIIAFVSIVSRAGSDIEAALKNIPEARRVVLVVLHHTFDTDFVVPDSRHCVNRNYVFTVDCLYHEDLGLLNCQQNYDALKAVKQHLGAVEQHPLSSFSGAGEEHRPCCPNKVKWFREYTWVVLAVLFVIILLIVLGCLLQKL